MDGCSAGAEGCWGLEATVLCLLCLTLDIQYFVLLRAKYVFSIGSLFPMAISQFLFSKLVDAHRSRGGRSSSRSSSVGRGVQPISIPRTQEDAKISFPPIMAFSSTAILASC